MFYALIGILHWAVELGWIDIFFKVSSLSQYQANSRVGHLEAAYHIFAYLRGIPTEGELHMIQSLQTLTSQSLTTMPIGRISMVKLKRNCQQICLSLMGIQ